MPDEITIKGADTLGHDLGLTCNSLEGLFSKKSIPKAYREDLSTVPHEATSSAISLPMCVQAHFGEKLASRGGDICLMFPWPPCDVNFFLKLPTHMDKQLS